MLPGPAARAAGDVAGGAGDRGRCGEVLARGDAAARLHDADVRHPGVGDRQEPARDRGRGSRARRARDHHLPAAAASSRSTSATATRRRGGRRGGARRAGRAPPAPALQPRRRDDRRPGRRQLLGGPHDWAWPSPAAAACWRRGSPTCPAPPPYIAGGVVSYSNEAKAELLGVDPALIEAQGRGLAGGRRGDGDRRAGALRRRRRRLDHRHRRPRRRHARRSRSATSASTPASPTAPRSPATRSSPAAATTSANARPWSACTCCASCSAAPSRRSRAILESRVSGSNSCEGACRVRLDAVAWRPWQGANRRARGCACSSRSTCREMRARDSRLGRGGAGRPGAAAGGGRVAPRHPRFPRLPAAGGDRARSPTRWSDARRRRRWIELRDPVGQAAAG